MTKLLYFIFQICVPLLQDRKHHDDRHKEHRDVQTVVQEPHEGVECDSRENCKVTQ